MCQRCQLFCSQRNGKSWNFVDIDISVIELHMCTWCASKANKVLWKICVFYNFAVPFICAIRDVDHAQSSITFVMQIHVFYLFSRLSHTSHACMPAVACDKQVEMLTLDCMCIWMWDNTFCLNSVSHTRQATNFSVCLFRFVVAIITPAQILKWIHVYFMWLQIEPRKISRHTQ